MKSRLYFLLGFLLLINSCKEADFMSYQDIDRLQFGPDNPALIYRSDYETNWKFRDTTKTYSFYFDMYTLGKVTDYDRPYKLVQVQEPNVDNAIPGVHYQAFDAPKSEELYVVKAGQSHIRVPIVFFRDASLAEKPFILSIQIGANEHFDLGPATNVWRKATVADRLLQPTAWNASATTYYWGKYSTVKHQFMIDATGQQWDQDMMSSLAYDETTYYRAVLKRALADYNNEYPDPLEDEFGDLVVFP
jgi:hypothetical protein